MYRHWIESIAIECIAIECIALNLSPLNLSPLIKSIATVQTEGSLSPYEPVYLRIHCRRRALRPVTSNYPQSTHPNMRTCATYACSDVNMRNPNMRQSTIADGFQDAMTDSIEIATPLKSTKAWNSNFLVPIQIKSKSPFEFVPRDTEQSEYLDAVDFMMLHFQWVAFSVETVLPRWMRGSMTGLNWGSGEGGW